MKINLSKISIHLIILSSLLLGACSQQRHVVMHQKPVQQKPVEKKPPAPHYQHQPKLSQRAQSAVVDRHSHARQRIVNVAHSLLGIPYKWGGNNPKTGFDCSGLTRFVHKQALGITIPRTTAQQRDTTKTINYAQLKPGDMLFFKTGKRANHVGVYIGNRKFIHAPASGKHVTVATMDNAYWHKRFVKFGTYL